MKDVQERAVVRVDEQTARPSEVESSVENGSRSKVSGRGKSFEPRVGLGDKGAGDDCNILAGGNLAAGLPECPFDLPNAPRHETSKHDGDSKNRCSTPRGFHIFTLSARTSKYTIEPATTAFTERIALISHFQEVGLWTSGPLGPGLAHCGHRLRLQIVNDHRSHGLLHSIEFHRSSFWGHRGSFGVKSNKRSFL